LEAKALNESLDYLIMGLDLIKRHTELDSKLVWDKAVAPLLKKPTLRSNYNQPELKVMEVR